MALIPNGDCESATPAITLEGLAERNTDAPYSGSYAVMLFTRKGFIGGDDVSRATWPGIPVTPGQEYELSYWYSDAEGPDQASLITELDPGDGTFQQLVEHSPPGLLGSYQQQTGLRFTAAGSTAYFRARSTTTAAALISDEWFVDYIEYRELDMAVELAERGIDAMVAILQSALGTELAAIDTARGDSITMDVPASGNYYKYPKAEIAGETVHVEVFEDEFEFLNPYSDAASQRAVYLLPLTVRITHFNRANYSAGDMVTRSRRYATGVFNVINKNPYLAGTDDAIQVAVVEKVTPVWVPEGEDVQKIIKTVDTLQVVLRCEEVQ